MGVDLGRAVGGSRRVKETGTPSPVIRVFNEGAERLSKNPKQGHSAILTPSRSILRDDLCRPDNAAGTSHMSNTCDRRF